MPSLFWTGTLLYTDAKVLLARVGTAFLILAAAAAAWTCRHIDRPWAPIPLLACGFCLFQALSGLGNPRTDWSVFADICVATAFYLASLTLTREESHARRLLSVWAFGAAVVSAYYWQHQAGWDPVTWFQPGHNAFGSTFGNRNYMAYFLVCSLPFAVYLAWDGTGIARGLHVAAAAIIAVTLIFCHSRSGIVVLCVTLPAYLWMLQGRLSGSTSARYAKLAFLASVIGLLVGAVGLVYRVAGWGVSEWDMALHGRWSIWSGTLNLIGESSWIGYGAGTFPRIFPRFQSPEFTRTFGFHEPIFNSHSVPLEILVESGILGGLLFLALVAAGSGLLSIDRQVFNRHRTRACFAGISLVGAGIFSLTGEVSHVLFCTLFSWLALAVLYNSVSGRFITVRWTWRPACRPACAAVMVASVAASIFFLARYAANVETKRAMGMMGSSAKTPAARLHLERALKLEPRNPFALYQLAFLEMRAGRPLSALEAYRKIESFDPYFENIHYNIGIALSALGEDRQALASFSTSAKIYPALANTHFHLALCHLRLGEVRLAERSFAQLLESGGRGPHVDRLREEIRRAVSHRD